MTALPSVCLIYLLDILVWLIGRFFVLKQGLTIEPSCCGTRYVNQAGLELSNSESSSCHCLLSAGVKGTTTPSQYLVYLNIVPDPGGEIKKSYSPPTPQRTGR